MIKYTQTITEQYAKGNAVLSKGKKILFLAICALLAFVIPAGNGYASETSASDTKNPKVTVKVKSIMNQTAKIKVKAKDTDSGISAIYYCKGKITEPYSEIWETKGIFL